ncbi:hypothetical protein ES702_06088 [subsurface metagenome]
MFRNTRQSGHCRDGVRRIKLTVNMSSSWYGESNISVPTTAFTKFVLDLACVLKQIAFPSAHHIDAMAKIQTKKRCNAKFPRHAVEHSFPGNRGEARARTTMYTQDMFESGKSRLLRVPP